MLANRMRENQLAHMSLDEEVCGTRTYWLCAPTELSYAKGLPKKAETPQVMMIKGGKIQKSNKKSLKAKDFGFLVSKNNVFYFNAIPSNGIYEIDMHNLVPNVNSMYNVSTKRATHNLDSTYLGHFHFAHISKKRIEKLQQGGILKSKYDESFDHCVSCLSVKMTRKSFPHRLRKGVTDLLGIIHTDVCGLLRHVSRQGASYFITFTDDYSLYGYVYLLKHKHEVFETFKVFKNKVENQLRKTIKAIRLDRGGEYIRQEFKDYLKACGIVQQLTPPYIPQHNGRLGLANRQILIGLPTKKPDKTPYGNYGMEKIPNLSYFKVWLPKEKQMGTIFYFPPENKIVVARYAEFFEKNLITQESFKPPQMKRFDSEVGNVTSNSNTSLWSKGSPTPRAEILSRSSIVFGDLNEPTSYKATMLDSESNKWIDAMNTAIQSMMDNMVWVLVDLPPGCFVDPNYLRKVCKLQRSIYGLKQASRSWNKRFDEESKRNTKDMFLVYGGNLEAELRVDCYCNAGFETDIDDMKSLEIYVSHVSRQGASYFITFTDDYSRYGYVYLLKHKHEVFETFKVFKNEVENQLGKTIKAIRLDRGGEYIRQEFKDYLKACGIVQQLTLFYIPQHNGDYALESATRILNMVPTKKLDKTPYELWYGKIPNLSYLKVWGCEALVKREIPTKIYLEEIQNEDTTSSEITSEIPMEVEGDLNEPTSYKAVMLDSKSNKWIDAIHAEIQSMMDNMVWVLVDLPPGCKTVRNKCILKKRTDMDGFGEAVFILGIGASTPEEVKRIQNVPYASAMGSIMYAVRCTRPNVAFANTKDMFLVYGGNLEAELRVDYYCNAGFETDIDDMKSLAGYKFISGLGIVPTINEPIRMFCDNSAALHFANEPGVQKGTRHYHRRYHYVRECIALGEIRFLKVHTDDNLADPFTKALPKGKLTQHARSMGLRLASSFM
ncbi:retrotransposon protein, putative, ty1-copia subclass [Tanacetum coccineum]